MINFMDREYICKYWSENKKEKKNRRNHRGKDWWIWINKNLKRLYKQCKTDAKLLQNQWK